MGTPCLCINAMVNYAIVLVIAGQENKKKFTLYRQSTIFSRRYSSSYYYYM